MMQTKVRHKTDWATAFNDSNSVMEQWLTQVNRLSSTLDATLGNFAIDLCSQRLQSLLPCEVDITGCTQAWVRQVLFYSGDRIVGYARTMIPPTLYSQLNLDALGNQPIGPQVLFKQPHLKRSDFEYCVLHQASVYYQQMQQWVTEQLPSLLYARRSRFDQGDEPILLVEVLLPFSKRPVTV